MKISKILIQVIAVAVTMSATEAAAQTARQKPPISSNVPKIKKKPVQANRVGEVKTVTQPVKKPRHYCPEACGKG